MQTYLVMKEYTLDDLFNDTLAELHSFRCAEPQDPCYDRGYGFGQHSNRFSGAWFSIALRGTSNVRLPHERLVTYMAHRNPGRTSMNVIGREFSLKPQQRKDLQKLLRDEKHGTTLALRSIGVTYGSEGKGAESEAKRPPIPTEGGQRFRSKAATQSERRRP
ncbi:hypothetical protein ABIB80_004366, partial [Bradyrhizobium sp. i1.15.2]